MNNHEQLVHDVGGIESAIWSSNDSVAYRTWDKATDNIFGPDGYATYWQQAKDEDIIKCIKAGREIIKNIPK